MADEAEFFEEDEDKLRDILEALNFLAESTRLHGLDWLDDAACADLDTSKFFGGQDVRVAPLEVLEACLSCPVRQQCLETVEMRERGVIKGHGIYAGVPAQVRIRQIYPLPREQWYDKNTELINGYIERNKRRKNGKVQSSTRTSVG